MTIAPEIEAEIRRLFFAEHWKVGTIARQLEVHHDVVRRVLGLLPPAEATEPRALRLDPYCEFIPAQLKDYPRLRTTRLFDMIQPRGYRGSVRTLRRWIARVRPAPAGEVFLRLAPLAGEQAQIDWAHTLAWGDGGYYGRLFLNVKGREPQGVVEPSRYEDVRDELVEKLESMPGPDGGQLGTRAFKPQDVYPEVRGVAPDLIVYFGDLEWRSVGQVGTGQVFTYENDTGPDGANHDRTAVFAMTGLPGQPMGRVDGMNLVDVGPTILKLYDIEAPAGVVGRSFL